MKEEQKRVSDWMIKFGQEVPTNGPTIPDLEVRKLRAKLILEEALETLYALGFDITNPCTGHVYDIAGRLNSCSLVEPSLTEVADGIADSLVVQLGTASACGIRNMREIFEEVMRSNDSKLWTEKETNERFPTVEDARAFTFKRVASSNETFSNRCILVKDSHGKVIKSPSYSPANIEPLLKHD